MKYTNEIKNTLTELKLQICMQLNYSDKSINQSKIMQFEIVNADSDSDKPR